MHKIISFVGLRQSGKSYKCEEYANKGFCHIDFADELREMLWDILGWRPINKEEYERFKKSDVGCSYSEELKDMQGGFTTDLFWTTGRQLLQKLGTEAIRKRDKNFWSNCLFNKALKLNKPIVVADCRFPNEIKTLLNLGNVKFIYCGWHFDEANPQKIDKEHYPITDDLRHESEVLGLYLTFACDLKHGQEVPIETIEYVCNHWEELKELKFIK